jgi:hypothetical protein
LSKVDDRFSGTWVGAANLTSGREEPISVPCDKPNRSGMDLAVEPERFGG